MHIYLFATPVNNNFCIELYLVICFRILMRCVLLLLVYQGRDIHGRIYLNEQGINAQVTQASAPQNIAHDSPNLCSKQMPSHPDCSIVVLGTTVTTSICPLGVVLI